MRLTLTGMFELFDFRPHDAQLEILDSPARFRVVRAGRRFGKTRLAAALATVDLMLGRRVWWIAPQHSMALEGYRYISDNLKLLEERVGFPFRKRQNPQLSITCPSSGGSIEFKSTSKTATNLSMVGAGLDCLYGDEVARIRGFKRMFDFDLRPTLIDRKGSALLITTPYGKGDFYRLYKETFQDPEWAHFVYETRRNPYLPEEEVERMYSSSSSEVVSQELRAEFIDSVGAYFPEVPVIVPVLPVLHEVWGYDYSPGTGPGCWALIHVVQDSENRIIGRQEHAGNEPYEYQLNLLKSISASGGLIVSDAHIPKSVKDDMVRKRIRFVDATTDRLGSLCLLRTYFSLGYAGVISRSALPVLVEQLNEAIVDVENPDNLFGDDDAIDAFRYGFHYLTSYTNHLLGIEPPRSAGDNMLDFFLLKGRK